MGSFLNPNKLICACMLKNAVSGALTSSIIILRKQKHNGHDKMLMAINTLRF